MNRVRWTLAMLAFFVLASWAGAQGSADRERINALVAKLGSASFAQREQARTELEAAGPAALDALRRAAKTSDAETSRRIAYLIARCEEQLLTKQVLAPKEVDLWLEGVTVQEAILELAMKSGYAIQFQGDATPFADKKVTLKGKMAFWQAFEKLCDQGGLMELVDLNPAPQPMEMTRVMRGRMPPPAQPASSGPIRLILRGKEKSLVSHAGSVKTEVRISRDAKSKELLVTLIVSAEPSLLNSSVVGRPAFAKLLDDKGGALLPIAAAPPADQYFAMGDAGVSQPIQRFTQFRLKDDATAAKQIKEMAGSLPLQLDLQNVLLARMEKVMESAGKSVNGANAGTLKVASVKKLANDAVEIHVSMENLTPNPFGNNIIINGGNVIIRGNINGGVVIGAGGVRVNGAGGKDLPDLLDAKGQKFKVASVANDAFTFGNGSWSRGATIVFQPNAGQAEPRELVLFGTRTHTIAVPFRFENVPLP